MDILIQDSWLREYLETPATPEQIQKYLSLCGPSVERVEKIDGETIYRIEVTTNRVTDSASVKGIAREAAAILPKFGINAIFYPNRKDVPCNISTPKYKSAVKYLDVTIDKHELCPRFTAILLRNVQIKPSSEKIVKRLERNGQRGINNVIDLTNYLTIELGQPMHVFDYDEIKGHKMILRESKEGEEIQTLDKVKRRLPKGSIVIEDGEGRLIDLCGIMGGFLSHTKDMSKNILLFIQTYDPIHIRKTCQQTAFRTDAAGLFEKWVDPESIPNALNRALEIIQKEARPEKIEDAIDIYPNPIKPKTVICPLEKLYAYADEKIDNDEILAILNSLEIKSEIVNEQIISQIPSFRNQDIEIPEDIIEEIVRIYGYFNLKGKLPNGDLPKIISEKKQNLQIEKLIKNTLVSLGFVETYTLSMISEKEIEQLNFSCEKLVKIENPLNSDENVMRPSLFPSLIKVIEENKKIGEKLAIFEMSNIYQWNNQFPLNNNQQQKLPEEKMILGIITSNMNWRELKGKLEHLFEKIGIKFILSKKQKKYNNKQQTINIQNYGKIYMLPNNTTYIELDIASLINNYSWKRKILLPSKFPEAYEDLALIIPQETLYQDIEKTIKEQSSLVKRVELLDEYGKTQTFRITYQADERNITNEEIKPIREKILNELKNKFSITLKT